MGPHDGEGIQLALEEDGRVDAHVVQVLAGHPLVIGDDHVARREAVSAVLGHAVLDDHAEVGHEVGYAAQVLGQQPAVHVQQRAAVVADLVDHHVV